MGAYQRGVSIQFEEFADMELRTLIAYGLIALLVAGAVAVIARFKRNRDRRRDEMRGRYHSR